MQPLYRNSNLIISRIDNGFFSVINPYVSNGLKIINQNQFTVLELIDGKTNIEQLAGKTGFSQEDILNVIKIFEKKNFVSSTNVFFIPNWNKEIKSINFWVHTTNDCCLRCSYCYIRTLGLKDFISKEIIEKLCDKIIETTSMKQLIRVSLRLAGGEPFIKFKLWQPYLFTLKEKLKDFDCKLNITFLTNLILLNDEIINFIKENQWGINVSLDGIGKFQNNTRHFENGNGSFDIVSKNIQQLIDSNIDFGIMTVVSNANLDGLEELTKFVIDKNLRFRFSFVQGADLNIEKSIEKLKGCYDLFSNVIDNGYEFTKYHSLCDLKFSEPFFQTCSNGFNGGAIYTDGNIYFCHQSFGTDTPNGSIFEEDDLLSVIQRKTYYSEVHQDCKECNLQYICTSGCPLERKNGKDSHCEIYKEIVPIVYKLMGKERLIKIKKYYSC